MPELPSFLAISVVVIITPGQDTALMIRNTLVGGRRGGVSTAIGISVGQATWTLATSVGLGALLLASEPAFVVLKLAGSAYLVFLGAQALRSALRGHDSELPVAINPSRAQSRPNAAFRQGLLSNLSNPKMLAFFTGLLPQFANSFSGLLMLGLIFILLALVWLIAYTFVVARARGFMHRARVRRTVEAITGTALVALGLRLATEQR